MQQDADQQIMKAVSRKENWVRAYIKKNFNPKNLSGSKIKDLKKVCEEFYEFLSSKSELLTDEKNCKKVDDLMFATRRIADDCKNYDRGKTLLLIDILGLGMGGAGIVFSTMIRNKTLSIVVGIVASLTLVDYIIKTMEKGEDIYKGKKKIENFVEHNNAKINELAL